MIIRQKKTANQCGQWSSFLEKKPRSSMLTFFFSPTQSIWRVNISKCDCLFHMNLCTLCKGENEKRLKGEKVGH